MENIIESFGISEFKSVYDAFQDEMSRNIFKSRVLYSVTGDERYLIDSISNISFSCPQDKLFSIQFTELNKALAEIERMSVKYINELLGIKKKVVLCGACGKNASHLLKMINYKDNLILADKNADDAKVFNYSKLVKDVPEALWIIPCNDYKGIQTDLLQLGVNQENILVLNLRGGIYWILDAFKGEIYKDFGRKWAFSERNMDEYFDRNIMMPSLEEVFIDCGFYDGETSRKFIKWCEGSYKRIIGFEADERLYNKYIHEVEEHIDRLELHKAACWESEGKIRFKKTLEPSAIGYISEDDDYSEYVDSKSIDGVLNGDRATFIKMDIEGSEYQALKGASNTIRKYRPKLAISVYHKPEDIIKLLVFIQKLHADYKFYLRTYEYTPAGVLLYAV